MPCLCWSAMHIHVYDALCMRSSEFAEGTSFQIIVGCVSAFRFVLNVLLLLLHNSISTTAVTIRSLQVDSILHAMHDAGIKISLFEVHEDDVVSPLSVVVNMSERHLPIVLLCRTDVIVDILVKVILDNATR